MHRDSSTRYLTNAVESPPNSLNRLRTKQHAKITLPSWPCGRVDLTRSQMGSNVFHDLFVQFLDVNLDGIGMGLDQSTVGSSVSARMHYSSARSGRSSHRPMIGIPLRTRR